MAKAWNIKCKNDAQKEALEALMNPEIDLVVMDSVAGGGKTYLALAAGLEQVIEKHMYKDIIFTRAPVSVGDELGFLPGTVDEKMLPWCHALLDNMEALNVDPKDAERYVTLTAIQHMRGRSLQKRYVVIDETQNLTKEQVKVLLTRAGEDTKVVCLGDSSQVDNKKLTKENNGLQYLVEKSINCPFVQVVKLPDGVRSRLCAWATEVL
jgi:PhoH-like ATPase